MTAYGIVIGLLLGLPWLLVGTICVGAALSAAKRWVARDPNTAQTPYPVTRLDRPSLRDSAERFSGVRPEAVCANRWAASVHHRA
jgi:hypothetical protein